MVWSRSDQIGPVRPVMSSLVWLCFPACFVSVWSGLVVVAGRGDQALIHVSEASLVGQVEHGRAQVRDGLRISVILRYGGLVLLDEALPQRVVAAVDICLVLEAVKVELPVASLDSENINAPVFVPVLFKLKFHSFLVSLPLEINKVW